MSTQKNHIFCWQEVTIIGQESDQTTRWIREAIRIRQEGQDIMNRDEEVFLPSHVYDDLPKTIEATNVSIIVGLTTLCGYNCSDS